MRRILVLGPPGAGKTTFARGLADRLALPVIHLDAHFWGPGWTESPRDEWRARVERLAARDSWVMDGNYAGTLAPRAAAADTAVLLLLPLAQCIARMVKRGTWERGRERPDLPPGCPEQLPSWSFLRWTMAYTESELPPILAALDARGDALRRIVLRSSAEASRFLEGVPNRPVLRSPLEGNPC